jgi:hypothetical protein
MIVMIVVVRGRILAGTSSKTEIAVSDCSGDTDDTRSWREAVYSLVIILEASEIIMLSVCPSFHYEPTHRSSRNLVWMLLDATPTS